MPRLSLRLLWVIGPCARLVASNYHSYGESPLSLFLEKVNQIINGET